MNTSKEGAILTKVLLKIDLGSDKQKETRSLHLMKFD